MVHSWLEHLFLDVVNPFVYRFLGKELLRAKPAINEEPGDKLHADAILGSENMCDCNEATHVVFMKSSTQRLRTLEGLIFLRGSIRLILAPSSSPGLEI